MAQFENVSSSRGAPMGRPALHNPPTVSRSVEVFKVRLDRGGYDDGGAYWGINSRDKYLYCARDNSGYQQFCRAQSREAAIAEFRLPSFLLKRAVKEIQ